MEYLNYYPTISLHSLNERVTANFGKKPFLFDLEGFYINQTCEKLKAIENEEVEVTDLDYIIREYMVHSGYQESFKVLDSISGHLARERQEKENENLLKVIRKESIDGGNFLSKKQSDNHMDIDDEEISKLRKYSEEIVELTGKPQDFTNRGLSMMIDRKLNDEESNNPNIFLIMNFLEERKSNYR